MNEKTKTQHTIFPAQTDFAYSNLGMSILGQIVRERSEQEYRSYIEANILDTLGLSSTRPYYPEEMLGDELAIGYTGLGRSGTRTPLGPFLAGPIAPAVGFTSSVVDLAKLRVPAP